MTIIARGIAMKSRIIRDDRGFNSGFTVVTEDGQRQFFEDRDAAFAWVWDEGCQLGDDTTYRYLGFEVTLEPCWNESKGDSSLVRARAIHSDIPVVKAAEIWIGPNRGWKYETLDATGFILTCGFHSALEALRAVRLIINLRANGKQFGKDYWLEGGLPVYKRPVSPFTGWW